MSALRKSKLNEALLEMEKKYFHLVWYARRRPEDMAIPGVQRTVELTKFNYPDEVNALESPEGGDWAHGFNSGVLAAIRFALSAQSEGVEAAKEEFPFLDT